MLGILKKRGAAIGWGVVASVALHLLIVAAFFIKLPDLTPKPQQDETVNVELVPPPEEKKPEGKKPPAPKLPAPKPVEPKPEEKKPEEKKQPEAPKAEKQAPPAPPPPPPKPPEKEPPKEPAKPAPDASDEKPADPAAKPPSMPVLRPVFQFGDKDAGPRKSAEGDSPVEGEKADVPQPKPEPDLPPPPTAAQDVQDKLPPGNPVPDDVQLPKVTAAEVHPAENGSPPEPSDKPSISLEQVKPAAQTKPEAKPSPDIPESDQPSQLAEAKTLYSQSATGSAEAQTAMANLSHGERIDDLCGTELNEQLKHSKPAYRPETLPRFRLKSGNVLQTSRLFFPSRGRWYRVSIRCEVNDDATKLVSFAFDVIGVVPPNEYKQFKLH